MALASFTSSIDPLATCVAYATKSCPSAPGLARPSSSRRAATRGTSSSSAMARRCCIWSIRRCFFKRVSVLMWGRMRPKACTQTHTGEVKARTYLSVDPAELGHVEDGGRLDDAVQGEALDQLLPLHAVHACVCVEQEVLSADASLHSSEKRKRQEIHE